MSSLRSYNFKSVDMLLASKAIVQSLSENLTELSAIRSNWTPEYVQQLSSKIDSAIDQFLGLDKKKALREMTRKLFSIQVPAQRDLSFLKTQIEVDFGDQAPELLKTLGFYSYFEDTTKGKQEAMIEMLSAFKKGFSDSLKQQLIDKGTSPDLLDRIVGYADQLVETNVSQEICANNSYYTSCTNDLNQWISRHEKGLLHYTSDNLPVEIITYSFFKQIQSFSI